MTAPSSQVTVGAVNVNGYATKDVQITYRNIGGYTIIRQMDGTGVRQQAWAKIAFSIRGQGRAPTELRSISKTAAVSVTVPDPEEVTETATYTVFIELSEAHNINAGTTTWTLECEEE